MSTRLQLLISGRSDGSAEAALKGTGDAVEKNTSRFEKFNGVMGKAALPAAAVVGGLAAIGKASFDSASAAEQATGAVEAVYGAHADAVKASAARAAQDVGLANSQYSELAAVLGAQLGNMGVASDQLAGQTDNLIGLGADLSAQFGGSTSDAVAALSSLMRGERDPIERYGVSINAAAVEAKKAELGLSGLTGEADKAATTQATLALLTEQTASAQGAFAREADTAAGQQQRMAAELENAKATLGEGLLPVVSQGAQILAGFAQWVGQNTAVLGPLAVVVGGLAAAVLLYNGIMGAVPAIQAVATAAQWLFNASLLANPVTWVVLGVIALIAILVLLVRNWDTVRAVAIQTWNRITTAVGLAATFLKSQWDGAINAVIGWWNGLTNSIQSGIDRIVGWFLSIPSKISGVFNSIRLPSWVNSLGSFLGFDQTPTILTTAAHPVVTGFNGTWPTITTGSSRPAASPPVIINIRVDGALDPRAVASQIRGVLTQEARVRGSIDLDQVVIA